MGNSEESRYSRYFVDGVIRDVNEWKKNRNNGQRIILIPAANEDTALVNTKRVTGREVLLDKASAEKQRILQNKFYLYKSNNPANNLNQKRFIWVNPIGYWHESIDGADDLYHNYKDMRDVNTIGADKYFHCKGHCEAAREGQGGRDASEFIGELREQFDEKVKGYPAWDCNTDRAANNQGRNGNPNISCQQVCGSLRPKGLKKVY